jgi:hypothetical protein
MDKATTTHPENPNPSTATITFLDESNNNINNTPSIYLILENPRKTCNWGPVLRCAAAFAVTQVIWVGYSTCNTEGSHGAASHVSQIAFPVLSQAISYIRGESLSSSSLMTNSECDNNDDDNHPKTTTSIAQTTQILGILGHGGGGASHQSPQSVILDSSNQTHCCVNVSEIEPTTTTTDFPPSYPVRQHPIFSSSHSSLKSLAIILSKDALGLPFALASVCDSFVHIPHVPLDDRILWPLDLPSCLSIVLHRLRQWAPYPERNSQGHKFHVETHRSVLPQGQHSPCQRKRPTSLEEKDKEILDSDLLGNFFSLEVDNQEGDY